MYRKYELVPEIPSPDSHPDANLRYSAGLPVGSAKHSLTYRNALTEEVEFLFQLYASTRAAELEAFGWDSEQRASFLKMQFRAQQISYSQKYPDDQYQIILQQEVPLGAMLVSRQERSIHLVDLALLPEYRDRGIGSWLLQNLLTEAEQTAKPIRLEVRKNNRAFRLYQRLGFSEVRDDGIYVSMEWLTPNLSTKVSNQQIFN